MKKSRFTESQIVAILKEHDATGKTSEICRQHGIHPNTLRNWKAKYGGLEVSDVVRMKHSRKKTPGSSASWQTKRWTSMPSNI